MTQEFLARTQEELDREQARFEEWFASKPKVWGLPPKKMMERVWMVRSALIVEEKK